MACVAFDFTKYFCKKKRPIRINNPKIKKNTDDFGDIDDYECLERIGQGANGAVYRARHKESGEIVAVKLEFDGLTRSTMAEIKILRSLCHPSIVQFKQVALGDFGESVYVVMEYAEQDLLDYIHDTTAKEGPFDLAVVKRLMRELVEGVDYLHHDCGVMHRDLKPSNILVDRLGKLKICDFGLSRKLPTEFDSLCTTPVGTLWYRAPELLLGESEYTAAIDMWAVGCIMAELFFREVLFRGQSEIQQLGIINAIFEQPRSCLRDKFDEATRLRGGPVLTEAGFDLLCRLLAYDSSERIKSSEAVNHRWFSE